MIRSNLLLLIGAALGTRAPVRYIVYSLLLLAFLPGSGAWAQTALEERPPPAFRDYQDTHGLTLEGVATPYAAEYASLAGIDLERLIASLPQHPGSTGLDPFAVAISSYRYCCNTWTYFRGSEVYVFEVMRLVGEGAASPVLAILHNLQPSADVLNDPAAHAAGWRLSFFNSAYDLLSTFDLYGHAGREDWPEGDMVYTNVEVKEGHLGVQIRYAQTGHTPLQPGVEILIAAEGEALRLHPARWAEGAF